MLVSGGLMATTQIGRSEQTARQEKELISFDEAMEKLSFRQFAQKPLG
jgi:hypothetical protein